MTVEKRWFCLRFACTICDREQRLCGDKVSFAAASQSFTIIKINYIFVLTAELRGNANETQRRRGIRKEQCVKWKRAVKEYKTTILLLDEKKTIFILYAWFRLQIVQVNMRHFSSFWINIYLFLIWKNVLTEN